MSTELQVMMVDIADFTRVLGYLTTDLAGSELSQQERSELLAEAQRVSLQLQFSAEKLGQTLSQGAQL